MFYSLTGKLVYQDTNSVAVDCNGIAFQCNASLNTLRNIGSDGDTVTLYTYLNIRQDGVDLIGFHNKEELETFKMLISVSGVGPKAALAILSELTPSQLAMAIANSDFKTITRAQGVGPKAAQRVVLELKDKIAKNLTPSDIADGLGTVAAAPVRGGNGPEAVSALVMLGYSQSEASSAVSKIDGSLSVEEIIKQALKGLM